MYYQEFSGDLTVLLNAGLVHKVSTTETKVIALSWLSSWTLPVMLPILGVSLCPVRLWYRFDGSLCTSLWLSCVRMVGQLVYRTPGATRDAISCNLQILSSDEVEDVLDYLSEEELCFTDDLVQVASYCMQPRWLKVQLDLKEWLTANPVDVGITSEESSSLVLGES